MALRLAVLILSAFATLQAAIANPIAVEALPVEKREQASVAAPVVSFADQFTHYRKPGESVTDCDPTKGKCHESETERGLEARQGQFYCPAGSTFQRSNCADDTHARVYCYNQQFDRLQQRWVRCGAGEICIQRGTGAQQRGRCYPIHDLVQWYTPNNGQEVGSVTVHATDKQQTASMVNNYYDSLGHPIVCYQSDFVASPGGEFEGQEFNVNIAESYKVNWEKVSTMKTSVKTGGTGHIKVASFIDAGFP